MFGTEHAVMKDRLITIQALKHSATHTIQMNTPKSELLFEQGSSTKKEIYLNSRSQTNYKECEVTKKRSELYIPSNLCQLYGTIWILQQHSTS